MSGTWILVADPLSPVGPPWIRLVQACPTDARSDWVRLHMMPGLKVCQQALRGVCVCEVKEFWGFLCGQN